MYIMLLYAATIFLSAFLLFQIQPVTAKMILPWFGGTSSVWNACMVFFQVGLVLGYLYAHWLHTKLSPRVQAAVHTGLLALSLLVLPVGLDTSWKGVALDHPIPAILGLLAVSVGLPYFLLSTTGSLLQAWYARSHAGAMPYRLYALSNLASMLGLLTYPVLVEPNLTVRFQAWMWSGAYAAFAVLCVATAWLTSRKAASQGANLEDATVDVESPSWRECIMWIALPASASILLLAATTHITQDIAAVPFLWVLPLSLYLLSFIICFEAPWLYWRPVFFPALVAALTAMAMALRHNGLSVKMLTQILIVSGALLVCCMFCHGELVRRKPHPRRLTLFYLMLSCGGALGGMFVGLAAPGLFAAYYEFHAGLAFCALLAAIVYSADRHWVIRVALAAAGAAYMFWLGSLMRESVYGYKRVTRNFYSQLRVSEENDEEVGLRRRLVHGRINHGEQIVSGEYRSQPTTYFCAGAGVGQAMRALEASKPRRIGLLGLGCGTLVSYARAGDDVRIYEINRQVLEIARSEFTYLADSPARVEPVLGDGRLMLERESDQQFDILVMDAFSGDSVPAHLITLEAFRTYFRHLKPGGILAVNITNTYLNLSPVMAAAAAHHGRAAFSIEFEPDDFDSVCFYSRWALMLRHEAWSTLASRFSHAQELKPWPHFRPWTDDYSNLFRILY